MGLNVSVRDSGSSEIDFTKPNLLEVNHNHYVLVVLSVKSFSGSTFEGFVIACSIKNHEVGDFKNSFNKRDFKLYNEVIELSNN